MAGPHGPSLGEAVEAGRRNAPTLGRRTLPGFHGALRVVSRIPARGVGTNEAIRVAASEQTHSRPRRGPPPKKTALPADRPDFSGRITTFAGPLDFRRARPSFGPEASRPPRPAATRPPPERASAGSHRTSVRAAGNQHAGSVPIPEALKSRAFAPAATVSPPHPRRLTRVQRLKVRRRSGALKPMSGSSNPSHRRSPRDGSQGPRRTPRRCVVPAAGAFSCHFASVYLSLP